MGEEYLHNPGVFDRTTERGARDIILTDEAGLTSDERWEQETAYLMPYLTKLPDGPILDVGCGIGRLAKALTDADRLVIGVDESATMREQAVGYVNDPLFRAVPWSSLSNEDYDGTFRSVIAVWVLQHIPLPHLEQTLANLHRLMAPYGTLLLVNRWHRAIPVLNHEGKTGWLNDGYDLPGAMLKHFDLISHQTMPVTLCEEGAYLRYYRRKA